MMEEKDVSSNVTAWVQLSDFEATIDEQIAKISQIVIKKCPLQSCNLSFIDEWSHRWDFHPDSSSRHWAWRPELFAFQKAASTTMSLNKGSGLRNMDATDKNLELEEAEVSNSDINKEKHAESSDLFPEKNPTWSIPKERQIPNM